MHTNYVFFSKMTITAQDLQLLSVNAKKKKKTYRITDPSQKNSCVRLSFHQTFFWHLLNYLIAILIYFVGGWHSCDNVYVELAEISFLLTGGSWDKTQIVRLRSQLLYLLSHLADPLISVSKATSGCYNFVFTFFACHQCHFSVASIVSLCLSINFLRFVLILKDIQK